MATDSTIASSSLSSPSEDDSRSGVGMSASNVLPSPFEAGSFGSPFDANPRTTNTSRSPSPTAMSTTVGASARRSGRNSAGKRPRSLQPPGPPRKRASSFGGRWKKSDFASAVAEIVELGKQRLDLLRKIYQIRVSNRSRIPTIAACMSRVYNLPGMTNEQIVAAGDALRDDQNRELFMTMNDQLAFMWVDRQVAMQNILGKQYFPVSYKSGRSHCGAVMGVSLYSTVFSSPIISDLMTILDDEDDYWDLVFVVLIAQGYLTFSNTNNKQRCRTRPFTGHQMICDILNGHPDQGYSHFRMTTTTFIALRDELVGRGLINSTRNMTADEQLAIFLYCIGHGVANRVLVETFQHSGETISRHFNNVLRGILKLKDCYLTLPPSNASVHPRIRDDSNFHPFKNAIGAVDGTHIPVIVRKSKQPRFLCSEGFTSQNMMAAVSFDHHFLFVCTGWEGSADDMRVLRWACESGGFTVPEGKYYLVDSRYANTDKFLAPYRGERYHLSQFDGNTSGCAYRSPQDLYNHHHSQLRNVVEKTFGILKRRFKILNHATPFPYKIQCSIAMACCVIHNFIRRRQENDRYFAEDSDPSSPGDEEEDLIDYGGTSDSRQGDDLRTSIADELWNSRN